MARIGSALIASQHPASQRPHGGFTSAGATTNTSRHWRPCDEPRPRTKHPTASPGRRRSRRRGRSHPSDPQLGLGAPHPLTQGGPGRRCTYGGCRPGPLYLPSLPATLGVPVYTDRALNLGGSGSSATSRDLGSRSSESTHWSSCVDHRLRPGEGVQPTVPTSGSPTCSSPQGESPPPQSSPTSPTPSTVGDSNRAGPRLTKEGLGRRRSPRDARPVPNAFPNRPGNDESGVSMRLPLQVRRLLGYQDSNLD
jgi:hypothetical protein